MITQEKLKELLSYNPETGDLIWKISTSNCVKSGLIAGTPHDTGYVRISIAARLYYAHRLVWLYVKGYMPEYQIDHKNGDRADNRIINLRHVTASCNAENQRPRDYTSSIYTGVSKVKGKQSWHAYITVLKKRINLGRFKTEIDAAIARVKFEDTCPDWKCNYQDHNRVRLRKLGYDV